MRSPQLHGVLKAQLEGKMRGAVGVLVLTLALAGHVAAAPRAHAPLVRASIGHPPKPVRACIDAHGLEADCGIDDPPRMQLCRASDAYGRCPGDPTCFKPDGQQIRCHWPVGKVGKVGDRRRGGVWLNEDGLLARKPLSAPAGGRGT